MSIPSVSRRPGRDGTAGTAGGYSYHAEIPADDGAGKSDLDLLKLQVSVLTSILLLTIGCGRLSTAPDPGEASPTVEEVRVHPKEFQVEIGRSLKLESEVVASDGSTLDRSVNWETRDTSVASIDSDGKVVGRASGKVEIIASIADIQDKARGSILEQKQVAEVNISPDYWSLAVDENKTFTATAKDSEGMNVNRSFGWSSTNTDVATVDSVGRVTAQSEGSAGIVAEVEGVADTAGIAVASGVPAMPPRLEIQERSRSNTQVRYTARWESVGNVDRYSWYAGSNRDRWTDSGSVADTVSTFTAPRSNSYDDSYFCVRAVNEHGESEQQCDGFVVPAKETDSTTGADPAIVFNPDRYSTQDELENDPYGVFSESEIGGNYNLDKQVGYPGGGHSMRYDYVDQGAGNPISIGRRIPLPRKSKEVWVEFDVRWSENWLANVQLDQNDGDPSTDITSHKFFFLEAKSDDGGSSWQLSDGTPVYRWAYLLPGPTASPPNGPLNVETPAINEESAATDGAQIIKNFNHDIEKYFDGRWHTVRIHVRHDPGEFEVWIDGQKVIDLRDSHGSFSVNSEISTTALLVGRNKDDGNPSGTESLWWGKISAWTSDPGW